MCNADTRESKENCRTVAVAVALNLSSILRISLTLLTAYGSWLTARGWVMLSYVSITYMYLCIGMYRRMV